MKLDDYQKADCARLRTPALDSQRALEVIEAALVHAWSSGKDVDAALNAALKSGAEAFQDIAKEWTKADGLATSLEGRNAPAQAVEAAETAVKEREQAAKDAEAAVIAAEASLHQLEALAGPPPLPESPLVEAHEREAMEEPPPPESLPAEPHEREAIEKPPSFPKSLPVERPPVSMASLNQTSEKTPTTGDVEPAPPSLDANAPPPNTVETALTRPISTSWFSRTLHRMRTWWGRLLGFFGRS